MTSTTIVVCAFHMLKLIFMMVTLIQLLSLIQTYFKQLEFAKTNKQSYKIWDVFSAWTALVWRNTVVREVTGLVYNLHVVRAIRKQLVILVAHGTNTIHSHMRMRKSVYFLE